MNPALANPPKRLRIGNTKGVGFAATDDLPVDPTGGDYGAGIIRGAAVITRGEALGHEFWVDAVMVQQVKDALAAEPKGFKSRFAHPGLSGDGIGKSLGRTKGGVLDGDIARGDIHFLKSAHNAPDGDLAGYTMDLAAEDPEVFGTSIVFEPDIGEEERFWAEHMDEDGNFKSPDPMNEKNLRHARLGKLWAVDVVDDPAANPGGMFSRGQEVAYEANALLEYAIGLTETPPAIEELGIDPTRVRHFFQRFLDTHECVTVQIHKEQHMAESKTATQSDAKSVSVDVDALRAEGAKSERERLAALTSAFPDKDFALKMFTEGKSVEQAQPIWKDREIERLTAEVQTLKAKLEEGEEEDPEKKEDEEEMEEGEEKKDEECSKKTKPAKFNAKAGQSSKPDFLSAAKERAKADKIPIHQAMSALARENPELHAAYVAAQQK